MILGCQVGSQTLQCHSCCLDFTIHEGANGFCLHSEGEALKPGMRQGNPLHKAVKVNPRLYWKSQRRQSPGISEKGAAYKEWNQPKKEKKATNSKVIRTGPCKAFDAGREGGGSGVCSAGV